MALLGNISRITQNPIVHSAYNGANERNMRGLTSSSHLLRFGTFNHKSAIPSGYLHPYTWAMPLSGGGLGCTGGILNTGTIASANMAMGIYRTCQMDGVGNITDANMGLIVSGVATLVGSGLFTADIVGKLEATATLAGTGDIAGSLGALAGLIIEITSKGEISETSQATAQGNMEAEISPFTVLSPQSLAAAVWNAIAAQFNDPTTMGGKLNLASSGGVDYAALADAVWQAIGADYANPSTLGGIVNILQTKLDELHKIQGLDINNPLTITPSLRTAGNIDLDLAGDGETITIVTRQ